MIFIDQVIHCFVNVTKYSFPLQGKDKMYYEAEERETINGYCVPVLINVSYHITHEFRLIDLFRYKEKTKCTVTIKKKNQ